MGNAAGGHEADVILEHYESEARTHGLATSSTMADEITRATEIDAALACLDHIVAGAPTTRLLEIGCGNGHMLAIIAARHPGLSLTGVDYSPDMVALAQSREIPGCEVAQGDVRSLDLPTGGFDVVLSERCVINVLDEAEQAVAFTEVDRVLKPGGHLVLIEAFTDSAANLNRAREELGLPPTSPPHHNRWLDQGSLSSFLAGRYVDVRDEQPAVDLPTRHFLSSHYFVSRVLYPAVTRAEVRHNTEFVKFFSFLPPQGEYSPIQLLFLRKSAAPPAP